MFLIIIVLLAAISEASAATNIETYSSATANTGGNSGSEPIQTGNASASSKVENIVESDKGSSSVKTEVKAEANGKKIEKKVEKTVESNETLEVVEEVKINSESVEDESEEVSVYPELLPSLSVNENWLGEDEVQDRGVESNASQSSFIGSVISGIKDIFNKIFSIFYTS